MRRTVLSLTMLVLTCELSADDKPATPPSPRPPTLLEARVGSRNEFLRCELYREGFEARQEPSQLPKLARFVIPTGSARPVVYLAEVRNAALEDVQLYVRGEMGPDPTKPLWRVEPAQVADWLKTGARIVAAGDLQKVDPDELKALKPGTLVLIVPETRAAPPKLRRPAQPMPRAK